VSTVEVFESLDGDKMISGVYLRVGGRESDYILEMWKSGKMKCTGCGNKLQQGKFYGFSQFTIAQKSQFIAFVCDVCTKPVQDAILQVQNAIQARPKEKGPPPPPGCGVYP
jgi:hypothetical protein